MITKAFIIFFFLMQSPLGGSYIEKSNTYQGCAIDTLFNYGKDKQIIAIKQEGLADKYSFYRQTGVVVQALLVRQQSLSRQSVELGAYLSRVLDKQLGKGRNEFGLWASFVILFNQDNRIEEVVIIEPHPSCYEDQFQQIRQALEESDDYWERPYIGDSHYYFTIGRCHVY